MTKTDVFFAFLVVFIVGAAGGFVGWHIANFLANHISFSWR